MFKCKYCSKEYTEQSLLFRKQNKVQCKLCYNKQQREVMHKRITKTTYDYFKHLMKSIVKRDKEVTITAEYLTDLYESQNGKCSITGIELKMNLGRNFDSISVDRIDNDKGYIIGNIQIVCLGYNMLKQNWDDKTIYLIASKTTKYFERVFV